MELTQALMQMTRAAEGRRVARKQLREAVELCVAAIVENTRTGDSIRVTNWGTVTVVRPYHTGSQGSGWHGVTRRADRKTLVLNHRWVVADVADDWTDGHNMIRANAIFAADAEMQDEYRLATPEVLADFAAHAGEVVAEFAALYQREADEAAAAAAQVATLAVR